MTITALDLFAGTGWGVAARWLGIREMGVEIMPEACATREANGMATIFHDVWEGLEGNLYVPEYQMLIASPPCQTFSLAGKGLGRKALDDVMEAIELHAYKDPARLREFGQKHDERTALVLTPLAYIHRDRPQYVALEQVPTVLPVWEACAEVMREWGYSIKVEILNAEQYGVPQIRKRAVLVARLDGKVSMPKPTHSRYYGRDPKRLDEGVARWATVGEAFEPLPSQPFEQAASASQRLRYSALELIPEGGNWRDLPDDVARSVMKGAYFSSGGRSSTLKRLHRDRPSGTVVGQVDHLATYMGHPLEDRVITLEEAAAIQTYPVDFRFAGSKSKQFLQVGNAVPPLLAKAVLSALIAETKVTP